MGESETAPLLPTAGAAVLDARQSGYSISRINSYADWSVTFNLSSLLAWLVIATLAIVLIFYVLVPLSHVDHNLLLPLMLLLSLLFLVVLAFLPEAQNKEIEHRSNLVCVGLLILIGAMTLNLYLQAMWWDPSHWWGPLDVDVWAAILRTASLVFSWLFLILQFIPLIRRVWKRQDTGLSLWSLMIMVITQALVLASLVARAEKKFQVERKWCDDIGWEMFLTCGPPFYGYARREHVWSVPLFWVLGMHSRMGYAIVVLVVLAVCAWWRGRKQFEEMQGEEDNDEERAVLEQRE